MKEKLIFKNFWKFLGYFFIFVVYVGSLVPIKLEEKKVFINDKVIHFAIYFLLGSFFYQAYVKKNYFRIILALLFMGFSIELLQGLLPYRSFETLDLVANALGVLTAFGLHYFFPFSILIWLENALGKKSMLP